MSPPPKHCSSSPPLSGHKNGERRNSKLIARGGRFHGQGKTMKVIVLGQASVGKTALTVRFVTRRFIWEYDPTLEMIYRQTISSCSSEEHHQDLQTDLEILDTAGQEENSKEKLRWADAFIIVYSVTDRCSFEEVMRLKFLCSRAKRNSSHDPVVVIVGNKQDLTYDRIVSHSEGEELARTLGCHFMEISVRESYEDAKGVFTYVCSEHKERRKSVGSMSPKFLARRRSSSTTSSKVNLDLHPPPPRERSTSFLGLPEYWTRNLLPPVGSSLPINEEEDYHYSV